MQKIFFDIPAGALKRSPELQDWIQHGNAVIGLLRQRGYDRVQLQAENRMRGQWSSLSRMNRTSPS